MAIQDYQPLDPTVIRQILEGRESVMEKISEQDQKSREAILEEKCSQCNGPLAPRLPQDVDLTFVGAQIRYAKWCSACQKYVT